jgi:uncharacterized protein YbjQ (UPF0145 family)
MSRDYESKLKFTVTTPEAVGYRIDKTLDEVSGISVHIWHIFSHICIAFRAVFGGEVKSWTSRLVAAKDEAIDRMCQEAEAVGANAVVGMNVQVSGIAVCASGTAVKVSES